MLAAISASHRSPLLSSFSLLYSSSSWVSVAYSKFGPWVKNQMRKVTLRVICRLSQKDIPFFFSGVCLRQNRNTKIHFSHLNNGVNRTGFLTETTIDALRHIDIVTRSSPAAIGSSLSFNGNGLRRKTKWPIVEWAGLNLGGHLFLLIINGIASAIKRSLIDLWSIHFWNSMHVCLFVYLSRADGFTQLTSNAALLSIGVPAEGVLATKPWWQRTFLKRVVDGGRLTEQVAHGHCQTCNELSPESE